MTSQHQSSGFFQSNHVGKLVVTLLPDLTVCEHKLAVGSSVQP